MHINLEEQVGTETDHATRVPELGNKDSKPVVVKTCGDCSSGRNYMAGQESSLERPTESQNVQKTTHLGISTKRAQFACGKWGK